MAELYPAEMHFCNDEIRRHLAQVNYVFKSEDAYVINEAIAAVGDAVYDEDGESDARMRAPMRRGSSFSRPFQSGSLGHSNNEDQFFGGSINRSVAASLREESGSLRNPSRRSRSDRSSRESNESIGSPSPSQRDSRRSISISSDTSPAGDLAGRDV